MKKIYILIIVIFLLIVKMYFTITIFKNYSFNYENLLANGDAGHYYEIAQNVHDYHVYSDNNSAVATEFSTWRAPIYPFVLSLFMFLSKNALVLNVIKVIFEVLCLGFVLYKLKRKIDFTVWFFLLFIFIEPQHLKYTNTLLSESFTAVLLFLISIIFIFKYKKPTVLLPIFAAIAVLTHPVSIFFCLALVVVYCILFVKSNIRRIAYFSTFLLIIFSWMLRNEITFHKGFYITASQGATFSKGWNEKVVTKFNNVDADLVDEGLNLKYLKTKINPDISILDLSKLYKKATLKFIEQDSIKDLATIVFVKIKSNFIPFPERSKPGFLELLGSLARCLYLVLFLQIIFKFIKNPKIDLNNEKDRITLVILAVLCGQILMSIFIYTGLRFNAIYGITLLFCFILLNKNYFDKFLKIINANDKTLNSNSDI